MSPLDVNGLVRAASDRQSAVAALQKKYQESPDATAAQLVGDLQELLATERIVLDAIITLFVELGHRSDAQIPLPSAPPPPAPALSPAPMEALDVVAAAS